MTTKQRAACVEEAAALGLRERRAAPGDLGLWLRRYLPEVFHKPHGDFHRGIHEDLEALLWGDEIEGRTWDAAAFAYPRGHGKTVTVTLGLVLHVITEWKNIPHFRGRPPFIVIVQDGFEGARDRCVDVREELEGNERIREDYGDLQTGSKRWTQADFETNEGVRVKAVGSRGAVRGLLKKGRRPTLILIDDLENDQDVLSKEQRTKLHKWLTRALIPTGIAGELLTIMVGTILHEEAELTKLLDTRVEESQDWLKRRYAALYDVGEDGVHVPDLEGAHVLWPEYQDREKLATYRRKLGPLAFAQEFLNLPVDDSASLFDKRWLAHACQRGDGTPFIYQPVERVPFDLVISTWDPVEILERAPNPDALQCLVTAWDLAVIDNEKKAREKDGDYYAAISVGLTITDRLQVRRIYRRRGMSPAEARERIAGEFDLLEPDVSVVENNAAQSYLVRDLQDERPDLPIKPHTTDKKKHDVFEGVPMLATLLERGRMDLCAATPKERKMRAVLTGELRNLGWAAHDDTVMALWMAALTVRKWQSHRDRIRRKRIGPPPEHYLGTFPQRVAAGGYND